MEVNIGREELIFESGPFTYFGIQTLNQVIESPSSPLLAYKGTIHILRKHFWESGMPKVSEKCPKKSQESVQMVSPKGGFFQKVWFVF